MKKREMNKLLRAFAKDNAMLNYRLTGMEKQHRLYTNYIAELGNENETLQAKLDDCYSANADRLCENSDKTA